MGKLLTGLSERQVRTARLGRVLTVFRGGRAGPRFSSQMHQCIMGYIHQRWLRS